MHYCIGGVSGDLDDRRISACRVVSDWLFVAECVANRKRSKRSAQMIHVRQVAAMDCGRAVTMSLTECDFATAKDHFPVSIDRFGAPYASIWWACQNITGRSFQIVFKRRPERMGRYLQRLKIKRPEIVLCYRPEITVESWRHHYIGIDENENIHDPLERDVFPAKSVAASKYADWLVLGVVKESA